jgi:hypothetical protein
MCCENSGCDVKFYIFQIKGEIRGKVNVRFCSYPNTNGDEHASYTVRKYS